MSADPEQWTDNRPNALMLDDDGGVVEQAQPVEPHDSQQQWGADLDVSVWADSSMTLPGQGKSGTDCGNWLPREFCDECGHVHFGVSRCKRRSCGDCSPIWTAERTEAGVKRIVAKRHTLPKDKSRRVLHGVVSAPEGEIQSIRDVHNGFHTASDLAKRQGFQGFYCVFHGYRVQAEVKREFREADPPMGIWRWILNERTEDWRTLTKWSPHWHIIGLCPEMAEDKPEEQDGWVCRRIDREGGRSAFKPQYRLSDREVYKELAGTIRYLMSHATFEAEEGRDCARWYGSLSTASFSPEELSDGAMDTIERITEEVVGSCGADREETAGEEDAEECEDCGSGSLSPIWDAFDALADPGWCDRIGRDAERRLLRAAEWRMGMVRPPPGLCGPRTREEAEETLEAML